MQLNKKKRLIKYNYSPTLHMNNGTIHTTYNLIYLRIVK